MLLFGSVFFLPFYIIVKFIYMAPCSSVNILPDTQFSFSIIIEPL